MITSTMWVLLVHGAFRGGWSLQPVADELEGRHGITGVAIDLPGAGEHYDRAEPTIRLADAVTHVQQWLVDRPTLLVGHSQGGLVVRALLGTAGTDLSLLRGVAHLDAVVPDGGQSALDLATLPPGFVAPDEHVWLSPPPRPEGDPIGARLTRAPAGWAGASMGEVQSDVPVWHAYYEQTPAFYPCAATRAALDARGEDYTWLPGDHDAPTTDPGPTAAWLAGVVAGLEG